MRNLLRGSFPSTSMVVLVLLIILALQESISTNITFGRLGHGFQSATMNSIAIGWLALRAVLVMVVVVFWLLDRKRALFKSIIVTNAVLTFGLTVNTVALLNVLAGLSAQEVKTLMVDVVLMATVNILIFSIW